MSGVVLRCPACGTTQGHPGECDACFEGEARYFCSNHDPGRWLDEPVCKACGARFGDAPKSPPPPPPRTAPPLPRRETRRPEPRPPLPRGAGPSRPGPGRPPRDVADPEDIPAAPSLTDLLADILEERERTRERMEELPEREPIADRRPRSVPFLGCLFRIVLFVLVLMALAVAGVFLLLGG